MRLYNEGRLCKDWSIAYILSFFFWVYYSSLLSYCSIFWNRVLVHSIIFSLWSFSFSIIILFFSFSFSLIIPFLNNSSNLSNWPYHLNINCIFKLYNFSSNILYFSSLYLSESSLILPDNSFSKLYVEHGCDYLLFSLNNPNSTGNIFTPFLYFISYCSL